MAEIRRAFGRAVLIVRRRRGWTQTQLADASAMHASDVSEIERGLRDPGLTVQRRLARALGVTLGELMALTDQEEEAEHRQGGAPP